MVSGSAGVSMQRSEDGNEEAGAAGANVAHVSVNRRRKKQKRLQEQHVRPSLPHVSTHICITRRQWCAWGREILGDMRKLRRSLPRLIIISSRATIIKARAGAAAATQSMKATTASERKQHLACNTFCTDEREQ